MTALRALSGRLVRRRRRDALPGFAPGLGLTLFWLGVMVVLPLTALLARPWSEGVHEGMRAIVNAVHDGRILAALRVSFCSALIAALGDLAPGLLIAWALVRSDIPGRRVIDMLVELPFALPTAVVGIAMATLYATNGWIGGPLAWVGLHVAYTRAGIILALMFIGLPFVVRTVAPVLRNLPRDVEEAAEVLGASRMQVVGRVILPALYPALVTAFGMAFARGMGEYGSVIFIAGNQPFHTEIAPLLIVIRLQEYDTRGATLIGLALVMLSLLSLAVISMLRRHLSHGRA
ncbi:sulfate ABC transporter permease subunit CysT [Komagataeibacter sp. FNDCR2]|uniref:sulfate ABC transporter permease subunit CysT n=1 Tax=Komagataeibacter sp. FNDCR2 TaxID=2878682 RepID=UPI001E4F5744|nr:sulfate ABC transporter permease subunit CysT [Komagataeibacter sp. FNDCR2]MCE2575167.1 sulfate ABC transporter permease subunit CysT [Komagataeibacter sp. FNDCR2]